MYGQTTHLEVRPTEPQRERVNDFLTELTLLSRKYRLLLDPYTDAGVVALLDMDRDTIVGLDVGYLVSEKAPAPGGDLEVVAYDCAASIQDGDWIVETSDGREVELREVNGSAQLLAQRQPQRHFPTALRQIPLSTTATKALQR